MISSRQGRHLSWLDGWLHCHGPIVSLGLEAAWQSAGASTLHGHRDHGAGGDISDPWLLLHVTAGDHVGRVDPTARLHAQRLRGALELRGGARYQSHDLPVGRDVCRPGAVDCKGAEDTSSPAELAKCGVAGGDLAG